VKDLIVITRSVDSLWLCKISSGGWRKEKEGVPHSTSARCVMRAVSSNSMHLSFLNLVRDLIPRSESLLLPERFRQTREVRRRSEFTPVSEIDERVKARLVIVGLSASEEMPTSDTPLANSPQSSVTLTSKGSLGMACIRPSHTAGPSMCMATRAFGATLHSTLREIFLYSESECVSRICKQRMLRFTPMISRSR
jgi:hypothetical protein